MPGITDEVIAKCEKCGYQRLRPFSSFDISDDSECPQCGFDFLGLEPYCSDRIDHCGALRPGQRLEDCPRDWVVGVLEKAFNQGLESVDLRISFTNRYEDEAEIEILAVKS